MAVIRDVMPAFEMYQPSSVSDAQKLLEQHGPDAWVLAGGLDSFDWLKDRIRKPKVVVDLSGVEELRGIRTTGDGIEIGAMTTLTELVNHPIVKQKYGLLVQAAEVVASPQIRNQGTLGGNVSQDTRCWYYRGGWPCYRAGGNICYADTPEGRNREHAILHADRCVAVNPSDTAPALIALPSSSSARPRASVWSMPRITSSVPRSILRGCTCCSPAICLLPFGFRPPGRVRNSILKKCETATSGIFRS